MKSRIYLSLVVMLAIILSACQSAQPAPQTTQNVPQPTQAAALPTQPETSPVPAQASATPSSDLSAYPEPAVNASNATTPGVLYPDSKSGDMVTWDQAQAMILNHEVLKISQNQALQITLFLKDGRSLLSLEPELDDVNKVIQTCGDPCKDISVTTE